MSFDTLLAGSKVLSLLIFFPFFLGVLYWTFRRGSKDRLEPYAHMPLQED